jgi:hypothetical protein
MICPLPVFLESDSESMFGSFYDLEHNGLFWKVTIYTLGVMLIMVGVIGKLHYSVSVIVFGC